MVKDERECRSVLLFVCHGRSQDLISLVANHHASATGRRLIVTQSRLAPGTALFRQGEREFALVQTSNFISVHFKAHSTMDL